MIYYIIIEFQKDEFEFVQNAFVGTSTLKAHLQTASSGPHSVLCRWCCSKQQ